MTAALDDVIVLDLTNTFSSSLTAAFLADFGSNVIRLDLPPKAREQKKPMAAGTTKLT